MGSVCSRADVAADSYTLSADGEIQKVEEPDPKQLALGPKAHQALATIMGSGASQPAAAYSGTSGDDAAAAAARVAAAAAGGGAAAAAAGKGAGATAADAGAAGASPTASASAAVTGQLAEAVGDSETAARLRHYAERKEARRKRREEGGGPLGAARGTKPLKGGALSGNDAFLSNVPEIDADIDFRFSFVLMGLQSSTVVSCAAKSRAYKNLSHLEAESSSGRLLSTVPYPMTLESATKRMKVAKLLMKHVLDPEHLPQLHKRVDALSSAMIFVFNIDDGVDFAEQIQRYEDAVFALRTQPRKFRCARAALLVGSSVPMDRKKEQKEDEEEETEEEAKKEQVPGKWKEFLDEYELVHGALWKFGPLNKDDAEALYGVFAEIASMRLLKIQTSQGSDSDGSHISVMPPVYEGEACLGDADDEDDEEARTPAGKLMSHGSTKSPWLSKMELGAA
eukprot:TRINITY_DN14587_c0_g6_i1.p1 TRINITY_DN14587_c0_g6~~TRINITY_DN14587_c0_g6_i1.p1  ORF type:complete len:453 (-),score=132.56 TRINITY_DN14587_c0_g6_i1:238-1596(-)